MICRRTKMPAYTPLWNSQKKNAPTTTILCDNTPQPSAVMTRTHSRPTALATQLASAVRISSQQSSAVSQQRHQAVSSQLQQSAVGSQRQQSAVGSSSTSSTTTPPLMAAGRTVRHGWGGGLGHATAREGPAAAQHLTRARPCANTSCGSRARR